MLLSKKFTLLSLKAAVSMLRTPQNLIRATVQIQSKAPASGGLVSKCSVNETLGDVRINVFHLVAICMNIPGEGFQAADKLRLCFAVLHRKFGNVTLRHVVHANAAVILRCQPPVGSPPPNITWYKNGEPLIFCCGRHLRASGKKLVIKGVSTNDSGDYQCVAENMAARRQGPMITVEVLGG